jgi:small subunit ribosomal protein S17
MSQIADLRAKSDDQLSGELLNLKRSSSTCAFRRRPTSWKRPSRIGSAPRHRPHQDAADRARSLGREVRRNQTMPKRMLTGTVVSDKTDKTVVVRVERKVKHPLYGKIIRRSKKYHAHDDANEYRKRAKPSASRRPPISKLKTWKVIERVDTHKSPEVAA